MQCRQRRVRDRTEEEGFTVIEMTVAMSIMAGVLLSFAYVMYGGLNALGAARQRSAFVEISNAELETLRAMPYAQVGVSTSDPKYGTFYPGGKYDGRDAVVVASGAPPAETVVTSSPVRGITLPYTVRRWVTWTDTAGGATHQFKRLQIEVEWSENGRPRRTINLASVLYPGGIGSGAGLNTAPVAVVVGPTPTTGVVGTTFSFDGTSSYDPDVGDTLTYLWNFGDGVTAAGATATHSYSTVGPKTVTLTVTDNRGLASTPVSVNVNVGSSSDTPPTASFTTDLPGGSGVAPLIVNFTDTSTDAEGAIVAWDWDWGDFTAHGNTANASHTFATAGTYTVTLKVTDLAGLTSTATTTITVVPLNCDVTGGYFKNPGTNSVPNDIRVQNQNNTRPRNSSFAFTATTNAGCTSVTARLPLSGGGTYTLALGLQSSGANVKTWTGTGAISSPMNLGASQTGSFQASDGGTSTDTHSYAFNVHT